MNWYCKLPFKTLQLINCIGTTSTTVPTQAGKMRAKLANINHHAVPCLSCACLSCACLSCACLSCACLSCACLSCACLSCAAVNLCWYYTVNLTVSGFLTVYQHFIPTMKDL